MTETIMLVKNPLGFAAKRKAALKKEGKLKNLAESFEKVVFKSDGKTREFHQPEEKFPSVKGLKGGERYYFEAVVAERGVEKDAFREGSAIPRAFWRKDGKRTSHKPIDMRMRYDLGRERSGRTLATMTVTVPEDADEIVFDLGAKLELEEKTTYFSVRMHNLLDPASPVKGGGKGKWVFDPEKKMISDGNWALSAVLDKKRNELTVRGDNEKTVGSGVLDFSNVKKDTGYTVTRIGKCQNVEAMTALIAPDVTMICDGGFSGSSNIVDVVVGDIKVGSKAVTPEKARLDRLSRLRLSNGRNVEMKTFDHRYRRVSNERAKGDLSVKGVKPGELYTAGLSMKRSGPGYVFINVCFRGESGEVKSKERVPTIVMRGPRTEGEWQAGEIVFRIPEGANEFCFDIRTEVTTGHTSVEIDKFTAYKIGEPLPVWPAEYLQEKVQRK